MDAEIQQLRMKNTEASGKMNILLNETGTLKNAEASGKINILPDFPIDDKIESQ